MTTILLTDCASTDAEITGGDEVEALQALYRELVWRNDDGDCQTLIDQGYVEVGSSSMWQQLDINVDACAFWGELVRIMLNDNQDYEVVA